jgi:3-phenylpropionate/cinnamic acid dioxygenase small subunit
MPAPPFTAQDRLDVMDVIASYALNIDAGNVDGWVANFHEDAVLDSISTPATGHKELRAWVQRLIDNGTVGGTPATMRHFVGLPLINGESGERCQSRTICVILDYDPEKKIRVPLVGSYEDTFTKKDGKWRFQTRKIRGDLSARNRNQQ